MDTTTGIFLNTHSRGGFERSAATWWNRSVQHGAFIPRPTGIDSATVYTDEHGEAILQFDPDVGAVLTPNANGLCDPGEVGAAALLGSATISAEALDPYQLTFNDPRLSNTLTKNVFELAGKSLDCVAKSRSRRSASRSSATSAVTPSRVPKCRSRVNRAA